MPLDNSFHSQPRDTDTGQFSPRPELVEVPKTVEDLKNHPLYCQLTAKMQKFVVEFVTNEYKLVAAVNSAYTCKSEKNAEAQGRNLLRNWKVRKLVSFMGDYSLDGAVVTRKEAIALISDRLRDKATPAQWFCKLYEMFMILRGDFSTEKLPEDEITRVDELVRVLETRQKKAREKGTIPS